MILHDVVDVITPEDQTVFVPLFKSAIKLNVQNVSDYFHREPDKTWVLDRDFPNCAPPWPLFWMEWKHPAAEHSSWGIGVLVAARHLTRGQMPRHSTSDHGWGLECRIFSPQAPTGKIAMVHATIEQDGHPYIRPDADGAIWSYVRLFHANPGYEQVLVDAVNQISYVVWLSLSLCHCQNVAAVEHITPTKLLKAQSKRGRLPILSHYTLAIEPMLKRLAGCAPAGTSLQARLHICRGHFKDYRHGGGLFGKQRGLYWWDMTLRGSSKKGVIVKNYTVKLLSSQ